MKPFNLEEAKAGKPVCTRDGRSVRIICFDRRSSDNYPIVALIKAKSSNFESLESYTAKGRYQVNLKSEFDLFMASEKREGWVNVYYVGDRTDKTYAFGIYATEKEAKDGALEDVIATVKITWLE